MHSVIVLIAVRMLKNVMINNDERINEINESLRLIEKKDGLVFGTDAYLLSAYLPKRSKTVGAELGCGTGVISLLATAKSKCSRIYALEVQQEFCTLTERNIELNGFSEKIKVIKKGNQSVPFFIILISSKQRCFPSKRQSCFRHRPVSYVPFQ